MTAIIGTPTGTVKMSDIEHWFWEPGSPHAIDPIHPHTGLGIYSGETLEQVRERYPKATVATLDMILEAEAKAYKSEPVRIDRERWDYMLNVLPPVQWANRNGAETFKMSEMTSGTITTILCRIGERYFEMADDYWTSHDDIATACHVLIKLPLTPPLCASVRGRETSQEEVD